MGLRDEEMAGRLWGPVTKERALQLGALAASSSVLLKTRAMSNANILRLQALLPQEVLPTALDSKASPQRAQKATKPTRDQKAPAQSQARPQPANRTPTENDKHETSNQN